MLKGFVVFIVFVVVGECMQIYNHFHQNHQHHHQQHHHQLHHGHHEDYHDHHPKYEFEYGVKDPKTGDEKSQHEHRDGDHVKGSYSIHDADGTKRIVEYSADKQHGFQANVKRLGQAHHPTNYKINHHYVPSHHHNQHGYQHQVHHPQVHHSHHQSHGQAESYVNINQHF